MMSLSSRLSAFFLGTLAAVLVAFSTGLWLLSRTYLHRQLDARLNSALETLAAAAEVDATGVEWEPAERRLTLGLGSGVDDVRWQIRDGQGRLVDQSTNSRSGPRPPGWGPSSAGHGSAQRREFATWRAGSRRLLPDPAVGIRAEPIDRRHPELLLVAALPLQPVQSALSNLAVALALLSTLTWLLAACAGLILCRRALAPLNRMASRAREMSAHDLGQRLPEPGTGDELEDLGRAFNDLLERVHIAFERQRRFTGDASHQLRTPLAALLGQVEVALRRERDGEEYRRVLALVQRRATHLRQIIESLLFLARAEPEATLPELDAVNLADWLPEHLARWSTHPRAADLRPMGDTQESLWIFAHPPLLAQAVDNLLDNAFKYSPAGTPVDVRAWREPGIVLLAIEDRGHGIDVEERTHIFEPFYRSPSARLRGEVGFGLGLSVAQRIVSALGGTIELASEAGAGSRFILRFPETTAPAVSSGEESTIPSPALL